MVFFLLGFVFYAALYAAIGAAVNTVQEAQNFVFPVIMPLILGLDVLPGGARVAGRPARRSILSLHSLPRRRC